MRVLNSKPTTYFDNRPAKEMLEHYLYSRIGESMDSNVLQITGSALSRHYANALKIAKGPKCKIYWVEAEPSIYTEMRKRYESTDINHKKVKLAFGDVTNYERLFNLNNPCRFEDLDFCGALSTTRHMIAHRLLTQSRTWPGQKAEFNKCLMFTAALRPDSMKDVFKDLNMILREIGAVLAPYETYDRGREQIGRPYPIFEWSPVFLQTGSLLKHLWIFQYKDTHNMVSCVIIYRTGKERR